MNVWDILILLLVAGLIGLALWQLRSRKGGCSCGCAACETKKSCPACAAREKESGGRPADRI